MELLDWLIENNSDVIIEYGILIFVVVWYVRLRITSRRKRQKITAADNANRHASVVSAPIPSQQLESGHRNNHEVNQFSNKELLLLIIDVRERLANIEGRLGAPTPRMSAVSPPLESPVEEPSAQSSR